MELEVSVRLVVRSAPFPISISCNGRIMHSGERAGNEVASGEKRGGNNKKKYIRVWPPWPMQISILKQHQLLAPSLSLSLSFHAHHDDRDRTVSVMPRPARSGKGNAHKTDGAFQSLASPPVTIVINGSGRIQCFHRAKY